MKLAKLPKLAVMAMPSVLFVAGGTVVELLVGARVWKKKAWLKWPPALFLYGPSNLSDD